ncbi:MAG: type I methionyl aminopeptidase [Planctomycetales bacterium]|nr:type I methionyl aminopeptidase [bacterium]UNM07919.1 MAG: type I methionyl aminopeptidase [Planctomycetales bacterium]
MVRLKAREDIAAIWRSGQVAGSLLVELREHIRPGVSAAQINDFAGEYIRKHNGTPSFLGYRGFPGNICFSINSEIVHGIPKDQVVSEGDIVTVDVGVTLDGYISDTAYTYRVGNGTVDADMQRLLEGTEKSLYSGIGALENGKPMRLASRAVEQELRQHGLGVIRELTGHGVGFELHEEPTFYNFDPGSRRPVVENGLVIAIEPMATLGSERILLASDDWTYLTLDGSLSAHYEHTVAVWDDRVFILTQPGNEEAAAEFS